MTIEANSGEGRSSFPLILVGLLSAALLLIALYTIFIELFGFAAKPGLPPNGQVQPIWIVQTIDHGLLHVPVLGDWGQRFLRWQASYQNPDAGPQAVWRWYALWFGVVMMGCCFLMLMVKRLFEPTNDETTVMHLKGDTQVAFRAKGFRG